MTWFVLGFIVMAGIGSTFAVPPAVLQGGAGLTTFLLSVALAAKGLETDMRKVESKGLRPILLGSASWLFIATMSLCLTLLFRP